MGHICKYVCLPVFSYLYLSLLLNIVKINLRGKPFCLHSLGASILFFSEKVVGVYIRY